jgi:hypothetical protein
MHVTHAELRALGRLHPSGELPRNPRTGLPEAGFLESILPAIVGIGATIASGGAAAPAMFGMMSGGSLGALASAATSTAMTGDLGKGVMSGLMSYGMGSALDSLAQPAADTAVQGTTNAAANTATSSLPTIGSATAPDLSQFATTGGTPPPIPVNLGGQLGNAGPLGVTSPASLSQPLSFVPPSGGNLPAAPDLTMGQQFQQGLTSTGDRFDAAMANLKSDPGGALSRTFIDNAKTTTLPLLVGAAGSMGQDPAEAPKEPGSRELQRRYPEQFPIARQVVAPPSDYRPGIDPEFDYFEPMASGGGVHGYYARGGIADANPQSSMRANIEAEAKMALLDHHPKAKEALRRYAETFGEDALQALTNKVSSMGGRIRGAGGGLDDLIPGTIEGRKEVRLADGEFVVPADVVSHLGDGSSDHGVRKLTEMMDRIRTTKTGTTKQAGHIKDKKVMPA